MAIDLDVLAPLKCLSLGFQQDIYDPGETVRWIQRLTWSVAELKLLMDNTSEDFIIQMQLNKMSNSVGNRDGIYFYQGTI